MKKQTMKVYHGLPKTITDEHTIFYASFDGNMKPEIGNIESGNIVSYTPSSPFGYHPLEGTTMLCKFIKRCSNEFTIDFFTTPIESVSSGNKPVLLLLDDEGNIILSFQIPSEKNYLCLVDKNNKGWQTISDVNKLSFTRISYSNGNINIYINGKIQSHKLEVTLKNLDKFSMNITKSLGNLSSIHISNIDRGDYFPNLPQDFIDGKAIIKPRFGQQQIKGDPLYSQYTLLKVEASTGVEYPIFIDNNYKLHRYKPELSVKGANNWSVVGTSFRIKGLNGEIINGVSSEGTDSSPTVKTEDGTNVVGTWSGLGTNHAIFTLGSNANITGKDLYVEYSLSTPDNNSDFSELPYQIDKAWTINGVEMEPVNEIIITDDFKGKVSGSMKECPHVSKYEAKTSLLLPSNSGFKEEALCYNNLNTINNQKSEIYSTTVSQIPQQLFIFDLVEIIERKFGCEIPSIDKVQWLKRNLTKCVVNHYGYGIGPNGNKLYMKVLNKGAWTGTSSHTSQEVKKLQLTWSGSGSIGNIDDGKVSILVYTDATDGATTSKIITDYISIDVYLLIDSAFTTLYCKNTRSREDKCNPVLIQKETKTIKRYLPSKDCFSTECKYVYPKYVKGSKLQNTVYKPDSIYLTTLGSGEYIDSDLKEYFANCLNYLGNDATKLIEPYKFLNNIIKTTNSKNLRFIKVAATSDNSNPYDTLPTEIPIDTNIVSLKPFLVNRDNELKLELHIAIYQNKQIKREDIISYSINNRLLVK